MFDKGAKWIESCVADNWEKLPIYPGSETQSECMKLEKDGFIIHVYSYYSIWAEEELNSISAWGPDKLALELPEEYDWDVMQANLNLCSMCGAKGPTVSLGFAYRVCKQCRIDNVARVEYPGWCN